LNLHRTRAHGRSALPPAARGARRTVSRGQESWVFTARAPPQDTCGPTIPQTTSSTSHPQPLRASCALAPQTPRCFPPRPPRANGAAVASPGALRPPTRREPSVCTQPSLPPTHTHGQTKLRRASHRPCAAPGRDCRAPACAWGALRRGHSAQEPPPAATPARHIPEAAGARVAGATWRRARRLCSTSAPQHAARARTPSRVRLVPVAPSRDFPAAVNFRAGVQVPSRPYGNATGTLLHIVDTLRLAFCDPAAVGQRVAGAARSLPV